MSKRQPMREVERLGYRAVGPHRLFGGQGFIPMDILSCGHAFPSEYLLSPSKTSYVKKEDGATWRKCKECPREEFDEQG